MTFLKGISALAAGALLYLILLSGGTMLFPYNASSGDVTAVCAFDVSLSPDDPSYQAQVDQNAKCYEDQYAQDRTKSSTYQRNLLLGGLLVAGFLLLLAVKVAPRAPFYAGSLLVAGFLLLTTDPVTLAGPISFWGLAGSYLPDTQLTDAERSLQLAKLLSASIAFAGLSAAHLLSFERNK